MRWDFENTILAEAQMMSQARRDWQKMFNPDRRDDEKMAIAPVAGWIASSLVTAGVFGSAWTSATLAFAYGLSYVAVAATFSFGMSELSKALGLVPDVPNFGDDLAGRNNQSVDPLPPMPIVFGQIRCSGPISYIDAFPSSETGDINNLSVYEVVLAAHECEGISQIWLNDQPDGLNVQTPGKGNTAYPDLATTDLRGVARYNPADTSYKDRMMIKIHLGADDQLADSDLLVISNYGLNDGRKGSDRGRGVCYAAIVCAMDQEVFASGQPNFSALVKGRNDIYDPRLNGGAGGYAWTDNAALCFAKALTLPKPDGGWSDITYNDIDMDALTEAADACDALEQMWQGGPTQKRYTCNIRYLATERPANVLSSLLKCFHGSMERINGKIVIRAGVYRAPEITLTEADWVSPISITLNNSIADTYNEIKPVMVSPDNGWELADVEAVRGEIAQEVTADDGANSFSHAGTNMDNGTLVRFSVWTGDAYDDSRLPAEIVTDAYYWIVNSTANSFQIANSEGGTPIAFSAFGAGQAVAFRDVYLTRDGGKRKTKTVTYAGINDQSRSRRIASIELKLDRNEVMVSGQCNLKALDIALMDTVRLIDNERGFFAPVGSSVAVTMDAQGLVTESSHGRTDGDPIYLVNSNNGFRQNSVYYIYGATQDTYKLTRLPNVKPALVPTSVSQMLIQDVVGKLFRVMSNRISMDNSTMVCSLILREANDDDYSWNSGLATQPEPGESVNLSNKRDVQTPTGLTLESGTSQLIKQRDGTIVVRVKATWDEFTDQLTKTGTIEIQWKLLGAADSEYTGSIFKGGQTIAYLVGLPEDDIAVRIRSINVFGFASNWIEYDNGSGQNSYSVVGKTAPPENVTSATATYEPDLNSVNVEWTNPSDIDLKFIEVYLKKGTDDATLSALIPAEPLATLRHKIEGVYPKDTDQSYIVQLVALDTTNNRSGVVETSPFTVFSLPTVIPVAPATKCLTVGAADYYQYTYNWDTTGMGANDYVAIQRWPAVADLDTTEKALGNIQWVQASLGTYTESVNFGNWIGARAWYVRNVNGRQLWSAENPTEWIELKKMPAPANVNLSTSGTLTWDASVNYPLAMLYLENVTLSEAGSYILVPNSGSYKIISPQSVTYTYTAGVAESLGNKLIGVYAFDTTTIPAIN